MLLQYFEDVKDELKTSKGLHTEASDSVRELQQNYSIYDKENYTVNMAEKENEMPEEQQEELAEVEKPVEEFEDFAEDKIMDEKKDEEEDRRIDKDEDEITEDITEDITDVEDIIYEDEDKDKIEDLQKEPPIFSFPPDVAESTL
ncbi:PREDICTED: glutamic acid-rich protein-like [Dinoponera quadriceps]|uniref:Glutamic acid-rich protein-like n=1 Tax=Dinoponera quadriceps TaxID=609295 RepID=A0A6P3Y1Z3_DINQU|nr:PREDICTED: glutamic acid-rich protein-like [Dinoponera quadriceps]